MSKKLMLFFLLIGVAGVMPSKGWSHCEIPCGIYDDQAKIQELLLHVDTIEKSINQITSLESAEVLNGNQLVRWVMNKDEHADAIKTEMATYFLSQRIKFPKSDAGNENYIKQLELTHRISVYAMKTKQSTDLENVSLLRTSLQEFSDLYQEMHGHKE